MWLILALSVAFVSGPLKHQFNWSNADQYRLWALVIVSFGMSFWLRSKERKLQANPLKAGECDR